MERWIPTPREDHRTVAARRKRDVMRERILEAMMALCSDLSRVSTSIEDVAQAAGISRGTFYKHFKSLDEAVVEAGRAVTDRMTIDLRPFHNTVRDPVERVGAGMRLFLLRAMTDARWAAFVLRAELVVEHSVLLAYITKDLRHGDDLGAMDFDDLQSAVDLVMGATVEGMRTILLQRTPHTAHHIDSIIRMTLRGLGVDKLRARQATEFSKAFVEQMPRTVLDHWKAQDAPCEGGER